MKALIAAFIFVGPVAYSYGYYTTNQYQVGNTLYTNTRDSDGNTMNITTNRVGNTIYSNGYDNSGNHVNCTTYGSGNYKTTTCY